MNDSKFIIYFMAYFKEFGQSLLAFFDARVVIMLAAFAAGWYFLSDIIKPIISTGFAFVPSIAIATLICLVVRKVLLNNKFDLQDHADRAKGGNMASAIVFAVVMAFMAFVFWRVHTAFTP